MSVRALAFDVFGTVVDWRSSIIRELEQFGQRHGLQQDWPRLADDWRAGYAPAMDRVRRGELPWTRIDDLHRVILEELLGAAGITSICSEDVDDLNRAWHRLDPWPDSVVGLTRLKEKFTITTLSNGNMSLLTNMAKRAGLPWDCVISANCSTTTSRIVRPTSVAPTCSAWPLTSSCSSPPIPATSRRRAVRGCKRGMWPARWSAALGTMRQVSSRASSTSWRRISSTSPNSSVRNVVS